MLEHCKQRHAWTKAKGTIWIPAKVQTFFVGGRRRFFVVDGGSIERNDNGRADFGTAVEALLEQGRKRDSEEAKEAARVDNDQLAINNTPWMRKTRWAKKFARRDLLAVAGLARKPTKDEGSLMVVWQSVQRVLERCRASIASWHDHEEDGDVVLGWLNSCQTDRFNPDPFSGYYEKSTHVNVSPGANYGEKLEGARRRLLASINQEKVQERFWRQANIVDYGTDGSSATCF